MYDFTMSMRQASPLAQAAAWHAFKTEAARPLRLGGVEDLEHAQGSGALLQN